MDRLRWIANATAGLAFLVFAAGYTRGDLTTAATTRAIIAGVLAGAALGTTWWWLLAPGLRARWGIDDPSRATAVGLAAVGLLALIGSDLVSVVVLAVGGGGLAAGAWRPSAPRANRHPGGGLEYSLRPDRPHSVHRDRGHRGELRARTEEIALDAFPQRMRSVVVEAMGIIPEPTVWPTRLIGDVAVGGESVRIPYRIYNDNPPPGSVEHLSTGGSLVIECWYSRHADGHVRERAAAELVGADKPWVVPFVVQLLGEYVVEIAELIESRMDELPSEAFQMFDRENPEFTQLTRDRVLSYWAAFYRHRYALSDYPPLRVMRGLGIWRGPEGRRRL